MDALEGEMEQLRGRMEKKYSKIEEKYFEIEEKFTTVEGKFIMVEGRLSSMENQFENIDSMMKKLIKMKSKASPTISRVDMKEKRLQEDEDDGEMVFPQEPSRRASMGGASRYLEEGAARRGEAEAFWRLPRQEGRSYSSATLRHRCRSKMLNSDTTLV
ncbi:hypothetical protein M5K25_016909 [Dendrobium thyrsiflorum]|uniref:Uncharacterized protein n=1 Tax=Dendrobium thyrsiflorum TaxID=117978 RepID=A0ABD0USS6_DENTH